MISSDAEFKKYINRLSHDDRIVKKQAIQYFAFHPHPGCIEKIRRILQVENDPKLIRWSAYALALNNDINSTQILKSKIDEIDNSDIDVIDWLKLSCETLNTDKDVNHILDLLKSKNIDDAREALVLSFAHKNKDTKLIKEISAVRFDHDEYVRKWSVLSLGNSRIPVGSSIVLPYLSDTNYLVREWATWSLAKIQDTDSIIHLKHAINDPNPRVREWAAKALSQFNRIELNYLLISEAPPA